MARLPKEDTPLNRYRTELFNTKAQISYLGQVNKTQNKELIASLKLAEIQIRKNISQILLEEKVGGKKR